MVEAVFLPACRDVASFTAPVRVEFFIQIPFVNIFVTVRAQCADVPELPFFPGILFMTGKTRRGKVASVEGEFSFGMIGNSERTARKTVYRVALGAIGAESEDGGELAFVVIFMTIGAVN